MHERLKVQVCYSIHRNNKNTFAGLLFLYAYLLRQFFFICRYLKARNQILITTFTIIELILSMSVKLHGNVFVEIPIVVDT